MQTDRNTLTVMHNKLAFRSTFGALKIGMENTKYLRCYVQLLLELACCIVNWHLVS